MQDLAYRILHTNREMIPIVHQVFVQKGLLPSTPVMKNLLRQLVPGVQQMRCIIDGLDECEVSVQTEVIKLLLDLWKVSGPSFRAIISCRDLPQIDRQLRPKITISLFQKTEQALRLYIRDGVRCLQDRFRHLEKSTIDRLEHHLLAKAEGETP